MDRYEAQLPMLRSLFGIFLAPGITEALLRLARPAVRLATGGGARVRLGGSPLLPPGEPWPTWQGRPLDYLGAVDFARLPRLPCLPPRGTYAFYYVNDLPRPWGDDPSQRGAWRVFTGELRPTAAPPEVTPSPERPLGAAAFLSLPSPQEPILRRLDGSYSGVLSVYEQLYAAWQQYVWPDHVPVHQVGGWPALVQRPLGPDCHCASTGRDIAATPLSPEEATTLADQWRLLLQLDSDPHLGWHWGEPGRIYFCTHQDDPTESTWLTLQATP
ncbi:hypothetical protein Acsp03_45940 [Actinomadura sp. NBRC 104412]|uniref:YwqG family protein n=1 Tax=Actinomadura sp. NBRC 104412 TaxID=3032203 RepID=UPI0024A09A66|nr:YwqG family protein [Actinomadura sp. NBRC 104412]GLZ07128.1 hypothetical protein Acsp03_45940 [Actinomadura sp. NBRC 104412]